MDINIGETPAGRLKMELFSDIVPKCVMSSAVLGYQFMNVNVERRRTSGSSAPASTGATTSLLLDSSHN